MEYTSPEVSGEPTHEMYASNVDELDDGVIRHNQVSAVRRTKMEFLRRMMSRKMMT